MSINLDPDYKDDVDETLSSATQSSIRHIRGHFNFVLSGTFDASVSLQRTFDDPDGSPTWHDVPNPKGGSSFTEADALVGHEPEGAYYRFNVTTYTSGDIGVRLSQ